MSRLDHHDEDLLAAYALDAVDADESHSISLHLQDCGRCRPVVDGFRASAACLTTGAGGAPTGLWDTVARRLEQDERRGLDVAPHAPVRPHPGGWRRNGWCRTVVGAAAAAVIVVGFGARVTARGERMEQVQAALDGRTVDAAVTAAERLPGARRASLRSPDGRLLAEAVIGPEGSGFLRAGSLRPLPADRTYQLWAVVGTERISAGLLGPRPRVVPFRVAGGIVAIAVTEEVAGGVVASGQQPVATGPVVGR